MKITKRQLRKIIREVKSESRRRRTRMLREQVDSIYNVLWPVVQQELDSGAHPADVVSALGNVQDSVEQYKIGHSNF